MRKDGKFGAAEGDEGGDEANWQDSYSDLMTDLLAIFVVLFAFAMMSQSYDNARKAQANEAAGNLQQAVVDQIQEGMDDVLSGEDGALPEKQALVAQQETQSMAASTQEEQSDENVEAFMDSADRYMDTYEESKKVSVSRVSDRQVLLRVPGSVLFTSGDAVISQDAQPVLNRVADVLSAHQDSVSLVRIEGHTDNEPISSAEFESNWELSTYRAVNVVKYLTDVSTLTEKQFAAAGYGEYQPIADNETEDGKSQNRRVDFIIELKEKK